MEKIVFVTHNKGKIISAQRKLTNVDLEIFEYDLEEPRSDDIVYISKYKVLEAYNLVHKPCISLDCGFWIEALNGFPRAFVNFALETIGVKGILKLLEAKENRACKFTECLSYYDGKSLHQFMGYHQGFLAKEIKGEDSNKKWSDLWYIFIPKGYAKTLAEMSDIERENRQKIASVDAFLEFANWYNSIKNSPVLHRKH